MSAITIWTIVVAVTFAGPQEEFIAKYDTPYEPNVLYPSQRTCEMAMHLLDPLDSVIVDSDGVYYGVFHRDYVCRPSGSRIEL